MSDLDLDGLADAAIAQLKEANRRLRAHNAVLEQRVATLEDGIRELWETWMDDDASWVEIAGTLDELHTSLDVSHDQEGTDDE